MDFAGFTIRSSGVVMMTLAFVISSSWAICPENSTRLISDDAEGNWYVIASTPKPSHNPLQCARLAIRLTSNDTFSMNITILNTLNNEFVRYSLQGHNDGMIESAWRRDGSDMATGPLIHRITYSTPKYDSDMIMVICDVTRKNTTFGEFSFIMSREKTVPTERLASLKNQLSQYVPLEEIIDANNTDCGTNE